MRRRPVKHFTLLELIVVMGILVLLSAVAIPAYSSLFSGRKTTLAANKLNGAVMEARAYAVSNKVYTALVFLREKVKIPGSSDQDGYIRFRLAELYHDAETNDSTSPYIWSRWAAGSDYVLLPENTMVPDADKCFGFVGSENDHDSTGTTIDERYRLDYTNLKKANLPDSGKVITTDGARAIIFRPNGQLASGEKDVVVHFIESNKTHNAASVPLRISWLTCRTKFMDPAKYN